MRLLDRYLFRSFLKAFLYCSATFLAIWLVFDVGDKINTFLEASVSVPTLARYYITQAPEIIVAILPIAILLALLFTLSRLSRTNEIVSMLAAGISVPRLLLPLFVFGLFMTGVSAALNYRLAPHSEQARKLYYEELRAEEGRDPEVSGQIFRNRAQNRTWFIQRFRPGGNEFLNVQIVQQDQDENIVTNHLAARAAYLPEHPAWELTQVKVVHYDRTGNITGEQTHDRLMIRDWSETPFRLASANMRAEVLSVPELRDYLRDNADFPQALRAPFATHLQLRFATPWHCLIAVLIAAPLAISFSRTGMLSNVALAIGLVFLHIYVATHLLRSFGEGDRIAPALAVWTPNVFFTLIGLFLLYLRSTNRELRELRPSAAHAAMTP